MEEEIFLMRGKKISGDELNVIRDLIGASPTAGRSLLSRQVCEKLGWKQPNGKLQDVACREILRRLHDKQLITLPCAQHVTPNARRQAQRIQAAALSRELPLIEETVTGWSDGFASVRLEGVEGRQAAQVWAEMMSRHHYLGYSWSVGRSIKYLFYAGADLIGGMSWGSACWKLASRDTLIGWDEATRRKNLQAIAGNHRFLILPWVRVKNLASHLLSRSVKQLPVDWKERYGVELYLLESFVDPSRFKGTCYQAANWIYLGQSKGSSKSGNAYVWHGQVKDIYVYPLRADYRERLCRL
jgi:hypothetical protein